LRFQHSLFVLADQHDRASNNTVFFGALDFHASTAPADDITSQNQSDGITMM